MRPWQSFLVAVGVTNTCGLHLSPAPTANVSPYEQMLQQAIMNSEVAPKLEDLTNSLNELKYDPGGLQSAATSGKPFAMTKIRTWNGSTPDYNIRYAANDLIEGKCTSRKWAVVTTIFNVTPAIKQLDSLPDWCTVVVADKKSLPSISDYFPESTRVRYLTPEEQHLLGFRSINETPWNHFARKNVGFLYAMREGAEIILDFDDDNEILLPITSPAFSDPSGVGAPLEARSASDAGAVNVYQHFEPSDSTWPRGLPLSESHQRPVRLAQGKVERNRIAVWQHLAQVNPDVDAVWRLTHALPLNFTDRQMPVVLEKGSWSPFNAQATLWTKIGFTMMRLPSTVHGRVSDIWRSYLAQPLLWNQNLKIAFTAPQFSVPNRNAHNLEGDFEAEYPLYRQAGAMMQHLIAMGEQAAHLHPHSALFNSYVTLYEHGILEMEDVAAVKAWIEDLLELGIGSHADALGATGASGTALRSRSARAGAAEESDESIANDNVARTSTSQLRKSGSRASRVALHMHVNWPEQWNNVLWYLDETKLCHPTNFVLCMFVSNWESDATAHANLGNITASKHGVPVSIVNCKENEKGLYSYKCLSEILISGLAQRHDADSILMMADDALLVRPWNEVLTLLQSHGTMVLPGHNANVNADHVTSVTMGDGAHNVKGCGCQSHQEAPCPHIPWMGSATSQCNYEKAIGMAFRTLDSASMENLGVTEDFVPAYWELGDVAYVPIAQGHKFTEFANIMYSYKVFEEHAFPAIAQALGGPRSEASHLNVRAFWGSERYRPSWSLINESQIEGSLFMHPLKLRTDEGREAVRALYTHVFS